MGISASYVIRVKRVRVNDMVTVCTRVIFQNIGLGRTLVSVEQRYYGSPSIALWMLGKIITITQTGIQQRVHDCGIKLGKLLKLRAVIYIRLTV